MMWTRLCVTTQAMIFLSPCELFVCLVISTAPLVIEFHISFDGFRPLRLDLSGAAYYIYGTIQPCQPLIDLNSISSLS